VLEKALQPFKKRQDKVIRKEGFSTSVKRLYLSADTKSEGFGIISIINYSKTSNSN